MSTLDEIKQQFRRNFVRQSFLIENDVSKSIQITPDSGNGYASWAVHSRGIGMVIMKKSGFIEGLGLGKYLQGIKFPVHVRENRGMRGIGYVAPEEAIEGSTNTSSDIGTSSSSLSSSTIIPVTNCNGGMNGESSVCSAVRRKTATAVNTTESGCETTKPPFAATPSFVSASTSSVHATVSVPKVPFSNKRTTQRKFAQISFIYLLDGKSCSMSSPAVGIHLGTTHSCVAVFQHGKIEISPNDQGSRTTPSCVSFSNTERLIGDAALNQLAVNPTNTVFDAKRLMGRKYDDPIVQAGKNNWPFEVTGDEENKSRIQVKFKNQTQTYYPEEISSMVIRKIKEITEAHLGKAINDAVVTVPTYFDDVQREATKQAGLLAGLKVLMVINDATAAAIAYCLDRKFGATRKVLTFHLGGGSLNVSLMTIENSSFEVKSTAGDAHLGGDCFDTRLVNHFVDKFRMKHDKHLDNLARLRLRSACKKAKHVLSVSTQVNIQIDSLFEGINFHSGIRFEKLIKDLLSRTIRFVDDVISDANMEKGEIQDVVLIGGSTCIPRVQSMLKDYFTGTNPNCTFHHTIKPDEVVAYGAAIKSAILLSQ